MVTVPHVGASMNALPASPAQEQMLALVKRLTGLSRIFVNSRWARAMDFDKYCSIETIKFVSMSSRTPFMAEVIRVALSMTSMVMMCAR